MICPHVHLNPSSQLASSLHERLQFPKFGHCDCASVHSNVVPGIVQDKCKQKSMLENPAICAVTPCPLRCHDVLQNSRTPLYLHPVCHLKCLQQCSNSIIYLTSDQNLSSSDFKIMAKLCLLLLPVALGQTIAMGQTTLEGTEVKVTTVTHRPFIMPNNLSSGERQVTRRESSFHLLPPQI